MLYIYLLSLILGATALPKEDILANMTEEEKEIEAEKLMNMFDRLRDLNVIKPMQVNIDGKIVELDTDNHSDED